MSPNDLAWADDTDSGQAHDDAYYEQMKIGLPEARGWLRGRYAHLPPGAIDSILRFFSPDLSQGDVLTGGQFFAGLRLAVHAENEKDIDWVLAFVQGASDVVIKRDQASTPSISRIRKRPTTASTLPPPQPATSAHPSPTPPSPLSSVFPPHLPPPHHHHRSPKQHSHPSSAHPHSAAHTPPHLHTHTPSPSPPSPAVRPVPPPHPQSAPPSPPPPPPAPDSDSSHPAHTPAGSTPPPPYTLPSPGGAATTSRVY
ncbi:hypothetical protein FPV67DRAFT_1674311 [Lyophyllum atratum]|nr:hypothetical protein FPV67DRAFT_1674311 [Lyophyllum atratum]